MSATAATLQAAEPRPRRAEAWPDGHAEANRIKLSWILRLHWCAAIGQSLAILTARWVVGIELPTTMLFAVVAIEVAGNLWLEVWRRRTARVRDRVVAGAMLFDAIVLTVLLALSGGYSNPFATLYLVNIALAAVLLDPAWAWAMLGSSLALFGLLFALEHIGALQVLSSLDQDQLMALHVQGMWAAFIVAAGFIVYIVQQVRIALDSVHHALVEERSLSARKDKVASLATFAAGAAHELSTPLSTIMVVVKELQLIAQRGNRPSTELEDLGLIRDQVTRCRDILHQMSAHAGENIGEPFLRIPLERWIQDALKNIPQPDRVDLSADLDLASWSLWGPPKGLARALRSLVKNALQASPPDTKVALHVKLDGERVRAEVVDRGRGMPREILSRAGEPFFTTKVPGEGMGLGLFLTQTLAAQLGGELELRSVPGQGTTAAVVLPVTRTHRSTTP